MNLPNVHQLFLSEINKSKVLSRGMKSYPGTSKPKPCEEKTHIHFPQQSHFGILMLFPLLQQINVTHSAYFTAGCLFEQGITILH
jgi:hypothetical protein